MSDFSSFLCVCIILHLAFELFTTYITLYFIQFVMKIAYEFKHTL